LLKKVESAGVKEIVDIKISSHWKQKKVSLLDEILMMESGGF